MSSGEKQKPGPHPHLPPEELVMDQNNAGSPSSSSVSVTDQIEEDVYDGDTLSCGSRSDCSSLTEMDDDLLTSLGEELGILQEEESTTNPQETGHPDPQMTVAEGKMAEENMAEETMEQNSLCPHSKSPGPRHTCVHPHHAEFSEAYLPPILFRLDPPSDMPTGPVFPLREGGEIVRNADGTHLRDFPFLPRCISINVPGWLLEYWFRTDQRLTYKDIIARMHCQSEDLPSENTLNSRRDREARGPLELSFWFKYNSHISRVELRRVEAWTHLQISYNTTMIIEYMTPASSTWPRPLPYRLRAKSLVDNAPAVYYPLDTFLEKGQQRHVPCPHMQATLNEFFRLAEQARTEGLESWEEVFDREQSVSKNAPKTAKKRESDGGMRSKRGRGAGKKGVESDE